MPDLSIEYMGLKLKNPIIVGSSTLTDSLNGIVLAEKYGAAAVVLKSLYEEDLRHSSGNLGDSFHPEACAYQMFEAEMEYGAAAYIELLKDAKSSVSIPVIASINCKTSDAKFWCGYAEKLQKAGADAIELNINFTSFDPDIKANEVAPKYEEVVSAVSSHVKIPVAVKIGPYFSALPGFVKRLKKAGASAVVFFNRYFQLGIDIDDMTYKPVNIFSQPSDTYNVLRWVGIVAPQVDVEICASTGIHSANEAIQHLIAGAKACQIVSVVYKKGYIVISEILAELEEWMDKKGFKNIEDFRQFLCSGEMNKRKSFERFYYNQVTKGHFDLDDVLTLGENEIYIKVREDYGI